MAHIILVCARPPARYATGADFNLWLQRFELYVAEAGIREIMQGKELLSLLDDEPFRIASQIGLVAEVNPEVVKTSLREQFCPVGNELEWQLKLHERRQKSNKKLSEFAGSLRVLADKAYPDWEPKQRLEIAKTCFIEDINTPCIDIFYPTTFDVGESKIVRGCCEAGKPKGITGGGSETASPK